MAETADGSLSPLPPERRQRTVPCLRRPLSPNDCFPMYIKQNNMNLCGRHVFQRRAVVYNGNNISIPRTPGIVCCW